MVKKPFKLLNLEFFVNHFQEISVHISSGKKLVGETTRVRGLFNPLTTNVLHHIETSQLTCITNEMTEFYMTGDIGR